MKWLKRKFKVTILSKSMKYKSMQIGQPKNEKTDKGMNDKSTKYKEVIFFRN